MVKTRKQLAATNPEEYLAKQWGSQFKKAKVRIMQVMKPARGRNRAMTAPEIERFRNCISALTAFRGPILSERKDLLAVVGEIYAYSRSSTTAAPSLAALLEVFIKEVLTNPTLRGVLYPYQKHITEVSGAPSIQELMLGHLCLSFPKQICPNFTDSFCSLVMSTELNDGNISNLGQGLGLDSTLALLNTSFCSPMPRVLQTYLAMLASRCIETQNPGQVLGLGFERAVSAFELSAKLYCRSLSNLDLGPRLRPYLSRGAKKSPPSPAPAYMDEMMFRSRNTRFDEVAHKDLVLHISSYIDETQQIIHESTRLQTGDTLKGIVSILLADKVLGKAQKVGCNISEGLVNVVTLARLMALSLLRVVAEARSMVEHAKSSGRRSMHLELEGQLMSALDIDSNAGYTSVGTGGDRIVRKIILDAISGGSSSSKRSVMMLQHFAKLMLLGLHGRVDFLWQTCILVLSAILNLMAFEGEEFDALKILAGDAHEPVETIKGTNPKRKCNAKQLEAPSLPKTNRRLQLLDEDLENGEDCCQSDDDMCDLQVRLENLVNHPPDDLADFFDCSGDMDLPCWLREREGYLKEMQAAKKKKQKKLRRLLGVRM